MVNQKRRGVVRPRWAWVAAVGTVVAVGGPAHAFYWKGWPGTTLRTAEVIISPKDIGKPGNPPGETATPPDETGQPGVPPDPTVPVRNTPEPSTLLAGLLGLTAVGIARRRRKG